MTRVERRRARIRRRRQRLAGITSLLTATVVAGVVASAYWTTAGSGVASATTAVLAVPAAVTAEASGSTVTVSWTGPAAPGGGERGERAGARRRHPTGGAGSHADRRGHVLVGSRVRRR